MWSRKGKIAVVGVAMTKLARGSERYLGPIAVETCVAAIRDAGLDPSDIDGFATSPRTPRDEGPEIVDGVHIVTVPYMLAHLSPPPHITWHATLIDPTRSPSAVMEAVNAVAAGACRYALVWRASRQRPSAHDGAADRQEIDRHAVQYKRYMAKYGAKREDLARLVLSQRRNANLNENAFFSSESLTLDDYMESPLVADPLSVLDCAIPVSGAGAIVLTTAERARDLKQKPAYVAGYGENTVRKRTQSADELEDYTDNNIVKNIWDMSGLTPKDVSVAQLHDAFSPSAMYWLEAAGFCKQGEGFELIKSGKVDLGGSLPINTSGGELSEGATEGMGQIIEAVRQVTGRGGSRQVKDAHVSLVTEGAPMDRGGGLLFTDQP